MHTRLAAIALAAATVLIPVSVPTAAAAETCGQVLATDAAGQVALSGDGKLNTRPFDLAGGAYTVRWSGAAKATGGSNLILSLKRTDHPILGSELLVNTIVNRDSGSLSGETQIYNVKPGAFYLDVMAPGDWSVTITPQV
jgi:hypothetical protein